MSLPGPRLSYDMDGFWKSYFSAQYFFLINVPNKAFFFLNKKKNYMQKLKTVVSVTI